MRTLIDIPDGQIAALSALCERLKQPRAAVVRKAIAEYLDRHQHGVRQDAFGLWGPDAADGLAYQDKAISIVTWIEVLVGTPPAQQQATRDFLNSFAVIPIGQAVAERAIAIQHAAQTPSCQRRPASTTFRVLISKAWVAGRRPPRRCWFGRWVITKGRWYQVPHLTRPLMFLVRHHPSG